MATELFFGSLVVLTLAAVVVVVMTSNSRIDYPANRSRRNLHRPDDGMPD